jgi:hypothetical protein
VAPLRAKVLVRDSDLINITAAILEKIASLAFEGPCEGTTFLQSGCPSHSPASALRRINRNKIRRDSGADEAHVHRRYCGGGEEGGGAGDVQTRHDHIRT